MICRSLVFALAIGCAATVSAQDTTTEPQQKAPSAGTAAAGEASTKPTRGFFGSLAHNLGDDLKHIPRKNSVYWLGAGALAATAVHPADHRLNAHLVGHSNPFAAGDYIGSMYAIGGAGMAAYLVGRAEGSSRVEHLGMDEIEGVLLAEG